MLSEEQKYGHFEQRNKTITFSEESAKWFKLLFDELSVRAKNVLLASDIDNIEGLAPWLLGVSNNFLALRNCGKNTSVELMEFVLKLREHVDCITQIGDETDLIIGEEDMQSNLHEMLKSYADYLQSIYNATKITLSNAFRAYMDSVLKFPKHSNKLVSQLVAFLKNPIEYRMSQKRHSRYSFADDYSKYTKKLLNVYNTKMAYEVFRHKDTLELLKDQIKQQINNQNTRFVNAFEIYFYEYCHNSILNLYYLICFTDYEEAKYRNLGEKSSKQMFLQLQEIRKLIEESIDTSEPDSLIRSKHLWTSLFIEQSVTNLLSNKYKQLGYFPFFLALKLSMLSDDNADVYIFRQCSNIYVKEDMKTLSDVAKITNLSRERVRQIRLKQFRILRGKIVKLSKSQCLENYEYNPVKDYELKNIATREEVPFNSNFVVWVICQIDNRYELIGNVSSAFFAYPSASETLFAVPKVLSNKFDFKKFIKSIETQLHEKRFYEERIELEQYVSQICKESIDIDTFYEIVKECRNIMERVFPDFIINNQIVFRQNARKSATEIIEDILRENGAPMTINDIADILDRDFPETEQTLSKIRANALRNPNIIAISRTSTYTLREWAGVEGKRGGTIRELAAEYLNSLPQPIAKLSDICEYIAIFRTNVKEGNVKVNLLLEANNKYSLYLKDGIQYIGFTDGNISNEYVKQERTQGRRTFSDSIKRLEQFIIDNGRFPYSSGVDEEEARLSRFYNVSLGHLRKGTLSDEEVSEVERITVAYGHLKLKKERVSWDEWLERFVKHITENNSLPRRSSPEYAWYDENKVLFEVGQLTPEQKSSFAFLNKIVARMS